MPAPTNGSLGESTPLLGSHRENEPKWKSYAKSLWTMVWGTLCSNYVNVLLVFVPLGIIAGKLHWSPTAVFILNFIAIMPLAALLSFATEELSAKLGQTLGGLCNATFGNAVELINKVDEMRLMAASLLWLHAVSIVALQANQIRVVQASMLGSILSNMLLVLGCCFLAGGIRASEREFNATVASTMSSLMAVGSAALIIPATLYSAISEQSDHKIPEDDPNIQFLSRGTAIILLVLYVLYIIFQLFTHHEMFSDAEAQEGTDDEEGPKDGDTLGPVAAMVALVLVTVVIAFCADYLVDSIDAIVETAHINKTFIGLILIPIVGNAAEHVTAVVVALKGKMDLAVNVAIGSSLQITLFVTPFLVILGWIMGRNMTLHFEGFETVIFFLSVLVVNYLIQDGKSNYLEGCMCLGMYIIIALAFYVKPEDASGNLGSSFFAKLF
ncbi:vacuolar calcium ion transporter-like protein /H(+) exchanger [Karstenula rhodostoma CBS 690.94]|uniref:Vacuolar calcium ion transporter n=1 Tax=Karstenula rhodostoma CBS 690.94 TaxID=1392251 RepID=A0A9P4PSV9_9PLEO|nr:vacuolar calcium ion transporter-like protein /H(+) exchanger [Karstenula rhodostoma CBS 690.94]